MSLVRLLAALAIVVASTVSTAHADTNDDKFLGILAAAGISDHVSAQHAVQAAREVCVRLDNGETPNEVAREVVDNSQLPGYEAGLFVGAAIQVYCPQYIPVFGLRNLPMVIV